MHMQRLIAYMAGVLFAAGLVVGGMANPAKVLAFLDITGMWDPSLALVMGGAVAVGLIGFAIAKKRTVAWSGEAIQLPTARTVDRRLVLGSLAFGLGWGLAGFCPGPAIVLAGLLNTKALLFVLAMLAGMGLFAMLERKK
jgi:uncharacterized membrane protein YedE/YeeE